MTHNTVLLLRDIINCTSMVCRDDAIFIATSLLVFLTDINLLPDMD